MQGAVVDREHDALPVAVPEGKLDQAGVKRQSCGATASRQIEQPQVRLCPILRVRPRHDRACTIRGQSRAAKRTRFPGLTRRALPIEPGELEVGVVDAVHQDVVGRSGEETAVPKGAHPLRDWHRIPRERQPFRVKRLRHERSLAKEQQASGIRIAGRHVGETDHIRHQSLRALLVRLRIECPDIAAAHLGRARRNSQVHEVPTVRQEGWQQVKLFLPRCIERGQR